MHQSIATIDSPEFINLQPLDLNPLMSSCEIKVFYLGKNRNHSCITKEVATDMAKTLRGAPIVGYYKEEKEDFADHGNRVVIDDEGVKFECLTKPYGFVSPNAKVWFQKFEETDEFGEKVTREYLMTTGYLWTGQFPECKDAVKGDGKPHSMELDEETMKGNWATDPKSGLEFFIINDAIFSKLCILGDDVEPCFEGSSVSAPKVSKSFSLDDDFKKTLFTMFEELKNAIKGGQPMENENTVTAPEGTEEGVVTPNPAPVTDPVTDNSQNDSSAAASTEGEGTPAAGEEGSEFAKKDSEDDKSKGEGEGKDAENKDDKDPEKKDGEDDKNKPATENACGGDDGKKKYELLESELGELKTKFDTLTSDFAALKEERDNLFAFKEKVEDAEKIKMINSFYMLSDEDKKEVMENRAKFTIDEIESKLSVICVRNKVNFNLENNEKIDNNKNEKVVTYNLSQVSENDVPAWISAVKNNQKR